MGAETGATAAQIEAAARSAWDATGSSTPFDEVAEYGGWFREGDLRIKAAEWAEHLVKPGYRIVGPDAVVLTEEQAETALDALLKSASRLELMSRRFRELGNTQSADQCATDAARYRALAAVLNGNG